MESIFGNTMLMSQKSLDYLWEKQLTSVNNITNVDTPGYKSKYVTFEEEFQKNLTSASKTGKRDDFSDKINNSRITIHDTKTESSRLDGNNVDTDLESVELVKSAYQYQYLLQSLNNDITRFRTVIKG